MSAVSGILLGAAVAQADSDALRNARWWNSEIIVKGEYVRACDVAFQDFLGVLERRAGDQYLGRIENYNFEVSKGNDAKGRVRYKVWVTPRSDQEHPGFFGGDAVYEIDAKTFQIIEKVYGK